MRIGPLSTTLETARPTRNREQVRQWDAHRFDPQPLLDDPLLLIALLHHTTPAEPTDPFDKRSTKAELGH